MKDTRTMTDTLIIDGSPRPRDPEGNKKAARAARKSTINLKLLLSTAALAATLDGWALLAAKDQSAGAASAVPAAEVAAGSLAESAGGAVSGSYLPNLPSIATVVPVPAIGSPGTLLAPGGGRLAAPANQPANRAASVPPTPIPAPAQAGRPALRKVGPPPVAVSRSSR
jgi:hypothetical protein